MIQVRPDRAQVILEAMDLMHKTEMNNVMPNSFVPSAAGEWRGVAYKLLTMLKENVR